jgi:hypothetical protein
MYLTVHAASGLVIGSFISSSLLAFLVGFISHLVLDMVPHDPIEIKRWRLGKIKKILLVELIDMPLMILTLLILTRGTNLIWTKSMAWAVVGALLLDFLWGLYYLVPAKLKFIFWPFYKINQLSHVVFTKNYYVSYKIWLPFQLTTLGVFVLIILFT